jgi:plasmid stabilization system protein ParE
MSYRVTESAEEDLIEIWSCIAQDDRRAASKLIRGIEARFSKVQIRPEIGPRRERPATGLRVQFD